MGLVEAGKITLRRNDLDSEDVATAPLNISCQTYILTKKEEKALSDLQTVGFWASKNATRIAVHSFSVSNFQPMNKTVLLVFIPVIAFASSLQFKKNGSKTRDSTSTNLLGYPCHLYGSIPLLITRESSLISRS
jgi:hypothetical protein